MTYTTDVILSKKYEALRPVKVILAGLAATVTMSGFMLIARALGVLQIDVGELLGALFGGNNAIGWVLHFAIGIAFAFIYVQFFNHTLPVISDVFRGALFGIIVFVFSEMVITVISLAGFLNWQQKESMALMAFANCLAHFMYGAVLGAFFKNK